MSTITEIIINNRKNPATTARLNSKEFPAVMLLEDAVAIAGYAFMTCGVSGDDATNPETIAFYNTCRELLTACGFVGNLNSRIITRIAKVCVKSGNRTTYTYDACKLTRDDLRKAIKGLENGAGIVCVESVSYTEADLPKLREKLEAYTSRLANLKTTGNCKKVDDNRLEWSTKQGRLVAQCAARKALEDEVAKIIIDERNKTPEQVAREKAELKAKRQAKQRAERAAKKAAKAAALQTLTATTTEAK